MKDLQQLLQMAESETKDRQSIEHIGEYLSAIESILTDNFLQEVITQFTVEYSDPTDRCIDLREQTRMRLKQWLNKQYLKLLTIPVYHTKG